jgi:hypothetical protein
MYIVYGKVDGDDSQFQEYVAKCDQIFTYADLSFTEGEFFLKKNEVVDDFVIEMKLKFPGTNVLTDVLALFDVNIGGIVGDMLDAVIYHKFYNVTVEIDEDIPDLMTWEFTDSSYAEYNTKDYMGNYMAYTGVGFTAESFSQCKITLEKQVKTLNQLVDDHTSSETP